MRKPKPLTYEDLTAHNLELRRELIACQDDRTEGEALVSATVIIRAKALALADAYQQHPWCNAGVHAAGMDLIKAVREESLKA